MNTGRWKATEWYASEIHTVVLDLVYQDVEDCGQLTILARVLHSNKSTKDKFEEKKSTNTEQNAILVVTRWKEH